MAQYIKATNFAIKDGLPPGDPLKIVSGTEINDELNAIQVAVNSKADLNSPTLTGVPLAPTAASETNTTQIATTAFVKNVTDPIQTFIDDFNATGDAPIYAVRSWVNFNGTGTVSIISSGNVISITDRGIGFYKVNLDEPMATNTYTIVGTAGNGSSYRYVNLDNLDIKTTDFDMYTTTAGGSNADAALVSLIMVE